MEETPSKFELGRKLGEGSYGRVHLCIIDGQETYAVKMLKKTQEGISSPLEMSIMASYQHPNLNGAIDITHDAYHIYIIQEAAECDLDAYLKTESVPDRMEWYRQMLSGLQCLHSENIIHCDLKPSNILVTKDLKLRLTDYSHSVLVLGSRSGFRHRVGSPRYSAPEVLAGLIWGKEIDIWSLGCIFYEISTRTRFLDNIRSKASEKELLANLKARVFANGPFQDQEDEDLILNYMLQSKPKERYTCDEILSIYFTVTNVECKRNVSYSHGVTFCSNEKISATYSSVHDSKRSHTSKERQEISSMLRNITRSPNILSLVYKLHESSPQILLSRAKAEACFILASKILEGCAPFDLAKSPHYELLEKELEICLKLGFLLH